jgi:hypothetical protein
MNIFYSQQIVNCSDVWFSSNMINCHNCLFCNNLENQSYCIKNQGVSKEEFERAKKKMLEQKNKFESTYVSLPKPPMLLAKNSV